MNDQEFIQNDLLITCADAVELPTDFLEGELNQFDQHLFETHLSLCEGCQAFLDQIKATIALLGRALPLGAAVLPSNFDELLMQLEAST